MQQIAQFDIFGKLKDMKNKWDDSICKQFCQEIEAYKGQGVVDDKCPDNCMKAHPEWKK